MADYTVSSGNVFKDLGLPEPEEKLAKAKLAYKISRLIATQGMTQKEAAVFLEISQYKMTQLRNGRLNSFTVDYLVSLVEKLERHIQFNAYDSPIQESTFIEIDDISEQLNERQKNALFHVEKNGQIATKEYVEINRVSRRVAYEELRDMTDKGLLSMIGKGRGSRYVQKVNN